MFETRIEPENQEKLIFIGPDSSVKRALVKVLTLSTPPVLIQNLGILFDTGDQYMAQALERLQTDPKMFLIIAENYIKPDERTKSAIERLKQSPRVKSGSLLNLEEIVGMIIELDKPAEATNAIDPAIIDASTETKKRSLGVLQHDLKDYVIAEEGPKYRQIIDDARKLFGIKPEVSDAEVEQLILTTKAEVPEKMHGEIEGVFCDFDDTLVLRDGTINEKVLKMLKEFAAAGKKVTIWTGGDVNTAREKLEKVEDPETAAFLQGLTLASKYDFAGATAEIVIDDMALEALGIMFKLKAKRFIKI